MRCRCSVRKGFPVREHAGRGEPASESAALERGKVGLGASAWELPGSVSSADVRKLAERRMSRDRKQRRDLKFGADARIG